MRWPAMPSSIEMIRGEVDAIEADVEVLKAKIHDDLPDEERAELISAALRLQPRLEGLRQKLQEIETAA
jgi:hypothetical protein